MTNRVNRSKVADGVAKCHPTAGKPAVSLPVSPAQEKARSGPDGGKENGWAEWTPSKIRQRRASVPPMLGSAEDDSDSDSDSDTGEEQEQSRESARAIDRELSIMRRFFDKWCRLAGVCGDTCDNLPEDECEVAWTKAIAPRVEGRIQMVTGSAAAAA